MTRTEAMEYYTKAQKQGQRDYREKTAAGQSPFLPVLDDILQNVEVESQLPLGLIEVPLELVIGTKTAGRTAAFASNFMPLLEVKTEFGNKWTSLCIAHLEEGIRDPIRCFEYLGRFYVQEGNKRVSVLKFFDASSVPANVTRVVPRYNETPEVRLYYEFMRYYPLIKTYALRFTKPGSFARLQKLMGKGPEEAWSNDDRADILSLYNWVGKAFQAHGGDQLRCTTGDVLLLLLRLYARKELADSTPAELSQKLDALWDDVLALQNEDPVTVSDKPAEPAKPKETLIDKILPGIRSAAPAHLKVAFVHERTAETSAWTSQHEFGRSQLDTVFEGKVETAAYFNAVSGQNADELVEQAIAEGADIVFTTSPKLVGASLRAAVKHPSGAHPQLLHGDALRQHPHLLHPCVRGQVHHRRHCRGDGHRGPHRLCGGLPQLRCTRQHQRFRVGSADGQSPRQGGAVLDLPAPAGGPADGVHPQGHHGGFRPGCAGTGAAAAGVRHLPDPPGRHAAGSGHAVLALGPVL